MVAPAWRRLLRCPPKHVAADITVPDTDEHSGTTVRLSDHRAEASAATSTGSARYSCGYRCFSASIFGRSL